jgi:SP family sugar:H+ symporter-like MFS transporter
MEVWRMGQSLSSSGAAGRVTIVAFFFGALGELMFGYDTGVIGVALLFIKPQFHLTPILQGWVVSSLLLGAAVGVGVGGILSDRVGRRPALMGMAVTFTVGALLAALAPGVPWLVLGRLVMGLGVGCSAVVVIVYLAELAPTERRGAIASLGQLMVVCGILLAYLVDYGLAPARAWRWMVGVSVIPSVILLLGLLYLPETPRWLVKRGRPAEAAAVLARLGRRHPEAELREIQRIDAIESGRAVRGLGAALRELAGPALRPALVAAVGLAVFVQLMGINSIIYYAPTTLVSVGFGQTAAIVANLGIGTLNVVVTLVAIAVIDRVGRRPLLLLGCAGMCLSMLALGANALLAARGSREAAWVTLICLAAFVGFFGVSWGACVRVMISELLPLDVRGSAMGLVLVLNWVANFGVGLLFPVVLAAFGVSGVFLIFAGIAVVAFLFVLGLIPETKGRSLERIEADLRARPLVEAASEAELGA